MATIWKSRSVYLVGLACLFLAVASSARPPKDRAGTAYIDHNGKNPASFSYIVEGIWSPADQPNADRPTTQNEVQAPISARVTVPEPISISRDIFDTMDFVFSIFLVVVAGMQVWLMSSTLRAAIITADASKVAADAANKNIEVLLDSQRAWLFVTIGEIDVSKMPAADIQLLWFHPVVRNEGNSPAIITKMRLRTALLKDAVRLAAEPVYDVEGSNEIRRFDGSAAFPPKAAVSPLTIGITGNDFALVRQGQLTLYLYGMLEYKDTAKRIFTTTFCFLYHVPGGFNPVPEGFVYGGPFAYNQAT